METGTIAIIGAGELGRQFACLSLRAGYRTILEDVSLTAVERAVRAIRELAATPAAALGDLEAKLATAHSVEEAVREADLIIETVADELEMKLELFTIFDKFAKPGAIFAGTSNSIRISDLAEMTFCPECCIGMRLASQQLQLVRGRTTSQQTVECCIAAARRMHLTVEVIHEDATLPATAKRAIL
jgi:3-hydroxybutyryl-CoA dehydrogenase